MEAGGTKPDTGLVHDWTLLTWEDGKGFEVQKIKNLSCL